MKTVKSHNQEERFIRRQICGLALQYANEAMPLMSAEHFNDVKRMIRFLAAQATGYITGRIAYPFSTGVGKTESYICVAQAIQDLGFDFSMLIAVESVRNARDLLNRMQNFRIGNHVHNVNNVDIFHNSEEYMSTVPPIDKAEINNTQFLIVCHQRIVTDNYHSVDLRYKNQQRDLVIWDERFTTSRGLSYRITRARSLIQDFLTEYENDLMDNRRTMTSAKYIYEYLTEVMPLITAIGNKPKHGESFKFPPFPDRGLNGKLKNHDELKSLLIGLLDAQDAGEFKIHSKSGSPSLISFSLKIDDDVDNVAILDAGHNIDKLVQMDRSIKRIRSDFKPDYRNVRVVFDKGGYASKTDLFDAQKRGHAVELVKRWIVDQVPEKEPCLICVQNPQVQKSPGGKLLAQYDTEADIREATKRLPAEHTSFLRYLHWGGHKATNDYKDCKYLAVAGMMYRDKSELEATMLGQSRDINASVWDKVEEIQASEHALDLYQLLNRGHSRVINNGLAGELTAYIQHKKPERLTPYLREIMPGIKIDMINSRQMKQKSNDDSILISDYVRKGVNCIQFGIDQMQDGISLKGLKKDIDWPKEASRHEWRLFTEALEGYFPYLGVDYNPGERKSKIVPIDLS